MGLFKKKSDPISERARDLNQEIAALETEIKKLSAQQAQPPAPTQAAPPPQPVPQAPVESPPQPQPRLRSTARPHQRQVSLAQATSPSPAHEPVFEQVDQRGIQPQPHPPPPERRPQLDVRKSDLTSSWNRLKNHFRGPPTSNPKLVNYLAAGSIQGLRPLRYERRVARNRFIVLVIILVLVLWGLIAMFGKHR